MDLITPGLGLVFWSIITFLFLLIVLKKFAWKPILGAIDERENGIKNALEAADKARLEMENLKADNERILNEARAEREAMLKDAREIKNKMVSDAKEEAQEQATKMITQAQEAIENEKRSAMAELKNHVASLSIEIAEKVVREELSNKGRQLELVESMLGDAKLN
ncbi:F0F1 ATP synthase subunit B [Gelidibacter japonicus]|jgi:F-type H+-transporting ATPase subunit b|uniref:F0F1 ATP synthase subunit B n=1 Tax=Gelidibacter japonicus TaxID=1962232 RepID=UPI0013CF4D2B|nr:F0F1 ATP synthase subunit B [Gelidibacter japonicus]MCL8008083.1 F0F1 ATP synthase subunit B [Gelidibacter japonicus]